MVTMFGWFSAEAERASSSNRASRSRFRTDLGWQDPDRNLASEACIARTIDLSHATRAQRRKDLVWAQSSGGAQGHGPDLPEREAPRKSRRAQRDNVLRRACSSRQRR